MKSKAVKDCESSNLNKNTNRFIHGEIFAVILS